MGCIRHMRVDEAVRPVVHPPRKVPVAMRDELKEELDMLVKEGIIWCKDRIRRVSASN